jgi:pimeloyl-ACP methyl ester carboxylesterase
MLIRAAVGAMALAAILLSAWRLDGARDAISVASVAAGAVPATVFAPGSAARAPAVVIAHGFAGSQQMMQQFATTLARAGFLAVTFDFPGHGRNREPLAGGITDDRAASRALLGALDQAVALARREGDGRVALVGHSMAADIVIRYALAHPEIAATVAISTFAPGVTPTAPATMLVVVGAWEPSVLQHEARRVVDLAAEGTARRLLMAPGVEHIAVIYSRDTLAATRDWLAAAMGRAPGGWVDARGPWIGLLVLGLVALAWPLASLLPRAAAPPVGPKLPLPRVLAVALLPALLTPPLLRFVPTSFLPLLLGDYLAVHFTLYGALTALGLWWLRLPVPWRPMPWASALAVALYLTAAFALPFDAFVTAFVPTGPRAWLALAMLAATLAWFVPDEFFARAPGAPRWLYAVTKACFLVSLAIAVALDLRRLFFLIIIIPVILLLFVLYGLVSRWTLRATGSPLVAAFGNAAALAWAIAVTFPLVTR